MGGERDEAQRYIAPTLIKCTLDSQHKAMQDEIFGPVLPVISVPNLDTAIAYVNRNAKPLALYVFSTNSKVCVIVFASNTTESTSLCARVCLSM